MAFLKYYVGNDFAVNSYSFEKQITNWRSQNLKELCLNLKAEPLSFTGFNSKL